MTEKQARDLISCLTYEEKVALLKMLIDLKGVMA